MNLPRVHDFVGEFGRGRADTLWSMTTPLHAVLGQSGGAVTYEQIQEACDQKLGETDELDWKRDLPLPADAKSSKEATEQRTLELAKDIAAMANGRGGMLVYGVREDGQNHAEELVGVGDLSDGVMVKRIHQTAYNFVHPPAQITCHRLVDSDKHVLVVEVPESEDAPHLVRPKKGGAEGWHIAPYRSGADTLTMVEKQLEAAYRQRFEGRRQRHRDLLELHDEMRSRHVHDADRESGVVIAVAQPARPSRGRLPGPEPDRTARDIIGTAANLAVYTTTVLDQTAESFPSRLLHEPRPARRSLRRHVFTAERQVKSDSGTPAGAPARVLVELHDDGTVGLLWRRGGAYTVTRNLDKASPTPGLARGDMDAVGVLLLSLLHTVAEKLDHRTDCQLRITVESGGPMYLIPDGGWSGGNYLLVPAPPSLELDVRLGAGPDERAADFLALAHDLNNMVEQSRSMLDAFWELPTSTRPDHPVRQLAQRLFSGEPNHPVKGTTMS